tara:strand:+ start:355 stop:720 length:366 start_codon:yes stop_codon:yes gene_type:complete
MLYIKKYLPVIFIATVLFFTTSCLDLSSTDEGGTQDLSPIIDKQELFEQKLNQIVKKIDALQKSVNQIKIAPPTADNKKKNDKPQRKPHDSNYVHTIPQGDSYFVGNPNAKVTITEFFDFQ